MQRWKFVHPQNTFWVTVIYRRNDFYFLITYVDFIIFVFSILILNHVYLIFIRMSILSIYHLQDIAQSLTLSEE